MKTKNVFKPLNEAAIGFTGLGITTAVGSGIAAQAPAGTPSLSAGFTTLAGFTPVIGTAIGGKVALDVVKTMQPKSKKYKKMW